MKPIYRLAALIVVFLMVFPFQAGDAAPADQEATPEEKAKTLLASLTPEERVGQLFLVTFQDPEADYTKQIYDLIVDYHVGGVVLLANNDNFLAHDQTVTYAQKLTRLLQENEYQASQDGRINPETGENYHPAYIPLFIGISQEGNGAPTDQIISSGITQLPSEMAIGATWQPELARQAGNVLGNELSTLGINLLLGPSLDVLELRDLQSSASLGIRTFGGDPYWVGEMGRAFITGVHEGSESKVFVVAKHFPGYGSSDRLPEEEVATVRKVLDQLRQFELAPFAAVTGKAPSPEAATDALLTSHIRYQGLQDNFREWTKPISFDQETISQLMSLEEFATWRQDGGILISDDLGSQAVKKFYDYTGQNYIPRYVARDAFLAGNDMLYLGDITTEDESDHYISIIRVLEFFTQRYIEDTWFAERVDQSVLRILTQKYQLFNNEFTLTSAWAPLYIPASFGNSTSISFDIIRQAATLLSPPQSELNNTMPEPPGRNDSIVFITDTRLARQCNRCPLQPIIGVNAMETKMIQLYSPQAGGQVLPANLSSYSFEELNELLNVGSGILEMENDLRRADWIVFLTLDETANVPASLALQRFLNERPELFQQKKVVVFALDAPYYLDTTEISRLSAYYALYSKNPRAIDVAARLLMQEIRATGSPPISVPGINYDINTATFPDPARTIELIVDLPSNQNDNGTPTPLPTTDLNFKIGDTIPIRTLEILDHNGHRVPDNTVVRFIVTRSDASTMINEAQTYNGIAYTNIRVDTAGQVQVRAESEPAKNSTVLMFDIPPNGVQGEVEPTSSPTSTRSPTPTTTLTPTQEATPIIDETPPASNDGGMKDLFLALLVTLGIGLGTYGAGNILGQVRWGVRGGFMAWIGGLIAYLYLVLKLPGSLSIASDSRLWGVVAFTFVGAGIGLALTYVWKTYLVEQRHDRRS